MCEDFVVEDFERRAEGGDKFAAGHYEAWAAGLDHDKERARPNLDLDDPEAIAARLWPVAFGGLDLAYAALTGGARRDPLEAEFSPAVLLAEMQRAAAAGL